MPSKLKARVGEPYANIRVEAKPEEELKLSLLEKPDDVRITPETITLRDVSTFEFTASKRGMYNLTFDISGPSAGDFGNTMQLSVRADDVFSRLNLRNSLLPDGCFWFLLKFEQHELWFSSTSPWYKLKTSPVIYSLGIVMLVYGNVHLPMSSDGVEIVTGSQIKLSAVNWQKEHGAQLNNHKDVPCEEIFLSERDMVELREARSIFWTLFENLGQILPYYMQMAPVTQKALEAIPFKPEILAGSAVQEQDVCQGAPTEDDILYVVFRFHDPFVLTILEEKFEIQKGDVCIIVDMLTERGNAVTLMFTEEAGAKFRHLDMFAALQKMSDIEFYFLGFSVSSTGQLRLPPISQDLHFWNGAKMFTYP